MEETIRVLHIVTFMPRAGLETMIMNYYRNINREKIQFDFLEHCYEEMDYDSEIRLLGGRIYRIPRLNPYSKKYIKSITNFFKEHKEYKIIHCHMDCMSYIPLKYAKEYGIKVRIAHAHNTNQPYNLKFPLKMYYKRKISDVATDLFACAEEAGKWMFRSNCFTVMKNAINTEEFLYRENSKYKIRHQLGIGEDFLVGHVGRFFTQKNHVFIIDIFKEIVSIEPNAKLILIGVGELQEKIRKKVNALGLSDSVIFYGLADNISELMSAMDIFLLPSLYEGLPVTLIEAQATGVRCYISDTISKESIITDNVHMLGLNQSASVWAKHIVRYGKNYRRYSRTEEIIENGFDVRERAQWLEGYYLHQSEAL